jgi:hypothetical protein
VQRNAVLFVLSSTLFVAAFLLLDGPGVARQLLLGAATTAFLGFFAVRCGGDFRQIVTVIVVATAGECVLSLGFGLYTYRNALIPAYVPFGHGIFYLLAVMTAREEWPRRHAVAITRIVLAGGTLYALGSFLLVRDEWGLLWWAVAATLIVRSRNQLLLSTCVIYTIILELAGTAIGNWRWTPVVPLPGLHSLHSANPPSGVGVLYVLLDLITVAICARRVFAIQPQETEEPA